MIDAVTIENVSKRFRNVVALEQVGFAIPQGKIFGLLGPNGAGKTTLMRILAGILGPDEGRIHMSFEGSRCRKERIGYLPEERGLYPKMKVKDLLHYFTALKGIPAKTIPARIAEGLERVGLQGQEQRKVEELSKGNQQRIQLLLTLLHQPDLLILDEPFGGLDPIATEQLKRTLVAETERGATVIISTHRMEDAEQLCPNIALIHRGRVLRSGPLDQIKKEEGEAELLVEFEGNAEAANTIPGILPVSIDEHRLRLRLTNGAPVPELIRQLSERIDLLGVTRREATLHEIFVRLVNEEEAKS